MSFNLIHGPSNSRVALQALRVEVSHFLKVLVLHTFNIKSLAVGLIKRSDSNGIDDLTILSYIQLFGSPLFAPYGC